MALPAHSAPAADGTTVPDPCHLPGAMSDLIESARERAEAAVARQPGWDAVTRGGLLSKRDVEDALDLEIVRSAARYQRQRVEALQWCRERFVGSKLSGY